MKKLIKEGYFKPEFTTLVCDDCICAESGNGMGTSPFDDGGSIDQDWK